MRRPSARAIAVVLALAPALVATPASAACHIADFTEHRVRVQETERRVTLTVHLIGGQPSCSGTVRYETVEGTAGAPGDYAHAEGVLTFVAGDDREETITIRIRDDERREGNERFEVRLREGQGTISPASTPAVVTIADDERAATGSPTPAETTAAPTTAAPGDDDGDDGGSSAGLIIGIVAAALALGAGAWALARRGRA